jgi:hypothetical protein
LTTLKELTSKEFETNLTEDRAREALVGEYLRILEEAKVVADRSILLSFNTASMSGWILAE